MANKIFKWLGWMLLVLLLGQVAALAAVVTNSLPAAASAAAPVHTFHWGKFFAPFHTVLLHYPIGFLTLVSVLEIYALFRPSRELRHAISFIMALTLVSSIVVVILGLLRAEEGGYNPHTVELHKRFGLAVMGLTILTFFAQRWWVRRHQSLGRASCYRALLILDLIALVIAGHQGGNLTHGSNYLVKEAPAFMRHFLEETPEAIPVAEVSESEVGISEGIYQAKIRPIFQAKCFACHGPEKQKGDLRLDQEEVAKKVAPNGDAPIKAHKPWESTVVKLITLPPSHDDIMPPDGKEPLTATEILEIIHWIQDGAPYSHSDLGTNTASLLQ